MDLPTLQTFGTFLIILRKMFMNILLKILGFKEKIYSSKINKPMKLCLI